MKQILITFIALIISLSALAQRPYYIGGPNDTVIIRSSLLSLPQADTADTAYTIVTIDNGIVKKVPVGIFKNLANSDLVQTASVRTYNMDGGTLNLLNGNSVTMDVDDSVLVKVNGKGVSVKEDSVEINVRTRYKDAYTFANDRDLPDAGWVKKYVNDSSEVCSIVSYEELFNTNEYAVVLELGQSNMFGNSGDTDNANYPFYSTNGSLYWNPITHDTETLATTRQGSIGSQSNYFADELYRLTGKKTIIINASWGGSALSPDVVTTPSGKNWSETGYLREVAEDRVREALDSLNISKLTAILWQQGETDAQYMQTDLDYTQGKALAAMQSVIEWLSDSFTAPIFISELGNYNYSGKAANTTGFVDMQYIHRKVANDYENVTLAFDSAKYFPQLNLMSDNLHYSYEGLKKMGQAFARALANNQGLKVNDYGKEFFIKEDLKLNGYNSYLPLDASIPNFAPSYIGSLDSIKNTSVVHAGKTQGGVPTWATGNGNVCTYTAFNNHQIQYWFGIENEFGWRSHTPSMSYGPWVRVLSDVTLRDSIRGRFLATYRSDGGYTESFTGHLDSVKTTAVIYSNTGGTGRPATANVNGHLMSFFRNVNTGTQLYFSAGTNEMYIRYFTGGSFSAWVRFWNDTDFSSANVTFWNNNTSAKESILIDGNTTTTVTYTLPSSATWAQVQPSNAAAGTAQVNYVEVSGTTLTIHTNNPTPSGTGNLSYNIQFK